MDVEAVQSENAALDRMMNVGSAPQYQKENMLMDGSRISPSKWSGRSKSPSKFSLNINSVPKSETRSMKRKVKQQN